MDELFSRFLKSMINVIYVAICGGVTAIVLYHEELRVQFELMEYFGFSTIGMGSVAVIGAVIFIAVYRGGVAGLITITAITVIAFLGFTVFHIPKFVEWLILTTCGVVGYGLEVKKMFNFGQF